MPRPRMYDRWIFVTAGLLVLAGICMVGSASQYFALSQGKGASYYLIRHGIHVALGLAVLFATMSVPYKRFDEPKLVRMVMIASGIALLAVLAMPASGGAHRWFNLGPFKLQPSEFVKISVIVYLAYVLSRKEEQVNDLKGVLVPTVSVVGALAFLITIQPDLGSAVMIVAAAGVVLFVAGLRWKYIGVAALAGAAGFVAALVHHPYRIERIKTFLNPAADPQGGGFQLNQSLLAVGSGGILGVGLGQGQQKAYYLYAAHTDFIFSVIGEELGLIGTLLFVGAILVLFWRGLRTARHAPDRFAFYVVLGATCMLSFQALTHVGVCVGLLPTKGLPLPLVSYGGSSLIASMALVGLLLNVSQHSN